MIFREGGFIFAYDHIINLGYESDVDYAISIILALYR